MKCEYGIRVASEGHASNVDDSRPVFVVVVVLWQWINGYLKHVILLPFVLAKCRKGEVRLHWH